MNKQISFRTFLIVFVCCFTFCKTEEGPIVKTPLGVIRGTYTKSYEGRIVTAFEGIPYAKTPIGDLRFKEPQPPDPWSGTLVANKTYVCMQHTFLDFNATGDEDCLYLYVYIPRKNVSSAEKLDVVVHIHGGSFLFGDPNSLAGPKYIMDRDLIYVSMNYRLGVLGFLSTEDTVVPGNNGLKDQALALKWIKDNIIYFGGNPDSVTLTGMSAGGACTHFHYFSNLSKGLFHRGHSQSGTALNPWALTKHPLKNARKLGEIFECNGNTSEELVNCLRKISGRNLLGAMRNFSFYFNLVPPNLFAPVIELNHTNAFLTDHPYKLLMEGKFHPYPWIASNTKDEGIIPIGFVVLFHMLREFDKRWVEMLPYSLVYYDTVDEKDKVLVAEAVKSYYLSNKTLSMKNVLNLIKLHTDRLFLSDTEAAIRLQAKKGISPVYYYYFDYLIHIHLFYKAKLPVVGHGDDFLMFYYTNESPKILQDEDNKMRIIFLDFLFNFAHKGIAKFKNAEWDPVSPNAEINYLHISSPDDIHPNQSKEIGTSSFWKSLPLKENLHLFI